jgi:hypothetical protein
MAFKVIDGGGSGPEKPKKSDDAPVEIVDDAVEVQHDIISFLEMVLRAARAGKIQSVAIAYVSEDRHPCTGWAMPNDEPAQFITLTACDFLHARIRDDMRTSHPEDIQ